MNTLGSEAWYEYGTMEALPEMQRNDTDIVFKLIAKNSLWYWEPVEDPVFAAHRTNPTISALGQKSDRYYADEPVSVVACAHQVVLKQF
jgi:hypothetical protein